MRKREDSEEPAGGNSRRQAEVSAGPQSPALSALAAAQARDLFPRGLIQPPGAFRFSVDALLLASFIRPENLGRQWRSPASSPFIQPLREDLAPRPPAGAEPDTGGRGTPALLDLGTGCGVVALAMLLRFPLLKAVGVDKHPPLVCAAKENAARLGLADRFSALQADIAGVTLWEGVRRGGFDLALANPPYRKRGQGRTPAGELRQSALVEEEGTLEEFCRAAAAALRAKGRFGCIFPAPRLPDLWSTVAESGFGPRRLLPVHSRREEAAVLVLVEAGKGMKADLSLEPPLVLYEDYGHNTRLTAQALAFCPMLAANQRRGG